MSSESVYKRRAKFGGMDASMISEMKNIAAENGRLTRMYAEMSMQNDLLKEAAREKALRPSQRQEMAMNVVTRRGVRITLACRVFEISELAIDTVGNAHVQLNPHKTSGARRSLKAQTNLSSAAPSN